MGIPVLIGLTVASMVASGVSQRTQQKATQDAGDKALIANQSAITQAQSDKNREVAMRLSEEQRKRLRESSTATAQSAYSGVAGISKERALNNILFQSTLNEDVIKANGETALSNIASSGSQQNMNIMQGINDSKAKTPSYLSIGINSAIAGAKTYAIAGGSLNSGGDDLPDYTSRLVGVK